MSKFSDPSDLATEHEQRERDILLAQHKARKRNELVPRGSCYNCEEEVEEGKLFCDADCAHDWHFRERMEKHR